MCQCWPPNAFPLQGWQGKTNKVLEAELHRKESQVLLWPNHNRHNPYPTEFTLVAGKMAWQVAVPATQTWLEFHTQTHSGRRVFSLPHTCHSRHACTLTHSNNNNNNNKTLNREFPVVRHCLVYTYHKDCKAMNNQCLAPFSMKLNHYLKPSELIIHRYMIHVQINTYWLKQHATGNRLQWENTDPVGVVRHPNSSPSYDISQLHDHRFTFLISHSTL